MYNILLVDDELFVLNGLSRLLRTYSKEFGEIYLVQDGIEALRLLDEHPIDIVITDLKMPYMNGIALIHQIVRMHPACRIIILSGLESFSCAQEAISNNIKAYLLKPVRKDELFSALSHVLEEMEAEKEHSSYVQALERQLEKHLPMLKDRFFLDLCNGDYNEQMAEFLHLQFKKGLYKIALLMPEQLPIENDAFLREQARQIACIELLEFTNSAFAAHEIPFWAFQLHHYVCLLLKLTPNQNNNALSKQLAAFQEEFQKESRFQMGIAVSGTFAAVSQLPSFLEQAFSAARQKIYHGKGAIIFYDDIEQNEPSAGASVYLDFFHAKTCIYRSLMAHQKDQIEAKLDELYEVLSGNKALSADFIRALCTEILSVFSIFAFEQNIPTTEFYYHDRLPAETIFHLDTLDEFFALLRFANDRIDAVLSDRNAQNKSSLVEKIKDYIQNNIETNVQIEQLADVFYLTPNYISTLFKRETGVSLGRYISQEKIAHAQRLLIDTKMKIYEVAQAVGYKDVQYFSRVFKKQTGMQPSDFRQAQHG